MISREFCAFCLCGYSIRILPTVQCGVSMADLEREGDGFVVPDEGHVECRLSTVDCRVELSWPRREAVRSFDQQTTVRPFLSRS